jgi:hypothetical protein
MQMLVAHPEKFFCGNVGRFIAANLPISSEEKIPIDKYGRWHLKPQKNPLGSATPQLNGSAYCQGIVFRTSNRRI